MAVLGRRKQRVNMVRFADKLLKASKENRSLLCVGLDPDQSLLPDASGVLEFNRALIEATVDSACAYKPNLAIYESLGGPGLEALEETIRLIRTINPDIPIIGDAKRGDIGNCSRAYAHTLFSHYEFDAVTVNPYMGWDSLEPFLSREEKGIFILCRTSNPGGDDLQELMVVDRKGSPARPLYQVVAELANEWNVRNNVGLVVGATRPSEIKRVRETCPDLELLIPGVGPQGGEIAPTVASAIDSNGRGFMINASRQIMNAARSAKGIYGTSDSARKKIHATADRLRKEINRNVREAADRSDFEPALQATAV